MVSPTAIIWWLCGIFINSNLRFWVTSVFTWLISDYITSLTELLLKYSKSGWYICRCKIRSRHKLLGLNGSIHLMLGLTSWQWDLQSSDDIFTAAHDTGQIDCLVGLVRMNQRNSPLTLHGGRVWRSDLLNAQFGENEASTRQWLMGSHFQQGLKTSSCEWA